MWWWVIVLAVVVLLLCLAVIAIDPPAMAASLNTSATDAQVVGGSSDKQTPKTYVAESRVYDFEPLAAALGDQWQRLPVNYEKQPPEPVDVALFDFDRTHVPENLAFPSRTAIRVNARALTAKGTLHEMSEFAGCAKYLPRGVVVPAGAKRSPKWPEFVTSGAVWVWRPEDAWGGRGVVFGRGVAELNRTWQSQIARADSKRPQTRAVLTEYVPRPMLILVDGERRKFHLRVHLVVSVKKSGRALWLVEGSAFIRPSGAAFSDDLSHKVHDSHMTSAPGIYEFPRDYPGDVLKAADSMREAFKCVGAGALPFINLYSEDLKDGKRAGFEVLGADVMFDEDDRAYIIEVNSVPGFGESHKAKSAPAILGTIARAVFNVDLPMPDGTAATKIAEAPGSADPVRFPWEHCTVERSGSKHRILVNGSFVGTAYWDSKKKRFTVNLHKKWTHRGHEEAALRALRKK